MSRHIHVKVYSFSFHFIALEMAMCKVKIVCDVFPELNVLVDTVIDHETLKLRKIYVSLGNFLSLLNPNYDYFNLYYTVGPMRKMTDMCVDDYGWVTFVWSFMHAVPIVYRVVNVSFSLTPDRCYIQRVIAPFVFLGFIEEVGFVDRIVKRGKEVRVGLDLGVEPVGRDAVFRVYGSRVYAKVYSIKDLPKPEEIRVFERKEKIGMVENMKTKHKEG